MVILLVYTIFALAALLVLIILYLWHTRPVERWQVGNLSDLLQTVFVFVALGFTIFTIQSTSKDTETLFKNLRGFDTLFSKMDSSLGDVSVRLEEMPKRIEEFGNSVKFLNNTIDKQTKDFQSNTKTLNETITRLSESVNDYRQNMNNISQQLKTIVDLTDKQLMIWKEQQKLVLEEIARRPQLTIRRNGEIVEKDTCEIVDVVIENNGNIEATINAVFLSFPSDGFVSINSPPFALISKKEGEDVYRFDPSNSNIAVMTAKKSCIIACRLKVLKRSKDAITYEIDYFSKYDSGPARGLLGPLNQPTK
jgi:hypothetical protein